jgi:hypothetical protein
MFHKVTSLIASFLIVPAIIGAVTWQMDSSPFSFSPTSAVQKTVARQSPQAIICKPDIARGAVMFRYTIPAGVRSVTLSIYDLAGACLATIGLKPGRTSAQWGTPENRIGAGAYLAILHYGSTEISTRFSIIK